jgi:hypothetical protein
VAAAQETARRSSATLATPLASRKDQTIERPIVLLMPSFVSVPEKTLEHWSSQYITFRYRTRAALWWPAAGEDISIGLLPARPGKAVQLELKTTTVVAPGVHEVRIDLGQLWEYRQRRLGLQPFYAFPRPDPDWNGMLSAQAAASGRAVTELAYARSGSGWWFADWMVLLTAADVAWVLQAELAAHGSRKRRKSAVLVRFENAVPRWRSGRVPSSPIAWRELWPALERCGHADWPQLIRIPVSLLPNRNERSLSYEHVARLLWRAAEMDQGGHGGELVTLEPAGNGDYLITSDPISITGGPDQGADAEENTSEDSDHRQIVFLDIRALSRQG